MVSSEIFNYYLATHPPSIVISAPVTNKDSSEAKYKAPHAILMASATLPWGDIFLIVSFISSVANKSSVIGVNTAPRLMAFTLILSLANVTARSLANNSNPPFEEE